MNKWIEGARPKTLIASLSPVMIGGVIAFDDGYFPLLVFIASLLFALCVQVGTNFANDYIDFLKGTDSEKRVGPRRLVQGGLVSPQKMRQVTMVIFGTSALLGIYLMKIGGWEIGILALAAILFGYLYTGGPFPLGYIGLGDLFVLIFFGPVATGGVYYLLAGKLSPLAILAGFPPGLLSTALLVMNNLRDFETDKRAGKKSLPVRFGMEFGKWEFASAVFLGALLPLLLFAISGKHPWSLSSSLSLGIGFPIIRTIFHDPSPKTLAPLFPKVGKLLTIYTLLFVIGWLV
jgi:1,4-dihydroxy-2-naphthoate octaprenyltransferase